MILSESQINTIYLNSNGCHLKAISKINYIRKERAAKILASRQAICNSEKYKTKQEKFKTYKKRVWELTEKQPWQSLENSNLRGFYNHHIDHVLSIYEAFKRNLSPEVPAHISNLRMIPRKRNMAKNTKTIFTNLFNEDLKSKH